MLISCNLYSSFTCLILSSLYSISDGKCGNFDFGFDVISVDNDVDVAVDAAAVIGSVDDNLDDDKDELVVLFWIHILIVHLESTFTT